MKYNIILILILILNIFNNVKSINLNLNDENSNTLNVNQTNDLLLKKQYYSIRSDDRKCATPHCGGFFLKKLNFQQGTNIESEEIYISEMMVSDPAINSTILSDHKNYQINHPNSMLIVSGEITADHHDGQYHCLHITDIFHQMQVPPEESKGPKPLVVPLENYYFLKPSPLVCSHIATNCPSIVVLLLNSQEIKFISSYSEPYSNSVSLLDQKWFTSRLLSQDPNYNAIVKGYIMNGKLIISNVFVNTVDPRAQCDKMVGSSSCNINIGQIPTFTRDLDRCPVFNQCVKRGPCHLGIPACQDGYKLFSIPSGSKGCPKYYCDVDLLPNPISTINHFF